MTVHAYREFCEVNLDCIKKKSNLNYKLLIQFLQETHTKKKSLRAGFEPAREDPIGFQVQRLNHSAITAMPD